MSSIRCTLVSDGSSDAALLPILIWLLGQHVHESRVPQPRWEDPRRLPEPPRGLEDRIRTSFELYPCDLLFVHRDAETESREKRVEEIRSALAAVGDACPAPAVCVVPVRMTEAWLLFDVAAIRRAAGNPNGSDPLALPPLRRLEQVPDPKQVLFSLIEQASGLRGRRLRKLPVRGLAYRVSQLIQDFSPLRELLAFQAMEADLLQVVHEQGWHISLPDSAGPPTEANDQ